MFKFAYRKKNANIIYNYIYIYIYFDNSLNMSQSPTLDKIDKDKHYIRWNVHNIALRNFGLKVLSNVLYTQD